MELNHDTCYRALLARDPRFDGLFFSGVTTTRIYCRPVCTARTPGKDRCRFFKIAAAAEQEGFRPCLRCRPELAPGHSSIDAVGRVARRAAARIEAGALDNGASLEDLAAELGMCSRQLRRSVRQELGVSPVQLAQTHRLLLAKQLLTETRLPITDVAFASGFDSLRRFNALFKSHYRMPPSRFRRGLDSPSPEHGEPLSLRLSYRPPLAWPELLSFLAARAVGGVERVAADSYWRTAAIGTHQGWLRVTPGIKPNTLSVTFAASLTPVLPQLLGRLRHLFDLGAQPQVIMEHLAADRGVGQLVRRCPGLRVPGAFCGFDVAVAAILGQRISVRAAISLANRLTQAFGQVIETPEPGLNRLAPSATHIADLSRERLVRIGISRDRAPTLIELAKHVSEGTLRLEPGADPGATIEQLIGLPGIGRWTAEYIAMRALAWPDAFPSGDLALRRQFGPSSAAVENAGERWRPWRAYAVMHIWNNLNSKSRINHARQANKNGGNRRRKSDRQAVALVR